MWPWGNDVWYRIATMESALWSVRMKKLTAFMGLEAAIRAAEPLAAAVGWAA
jgi:hypothetical protein